MKQISQDDNVDWCAQCNYSVKRKRTKHSLGITPVKRIRKPAENSRLDILATLSSLEYYSKLIIIKSIQKQKLLDTFVSSSSEEFKKYGSNFVDELQSVSNDLARIMYQYRQINNCTVI